MARLVTGRWPSSSSRYSTMERVLASRFRPLRRTSLGLPVLPEVVSRRASSGVELRAPARRGGGAERCPPPPAPGTKPSSTRPVSAGGRRHMDEGGAVGLQQAAQQLRRNVGVQQQGHFSRF